MHRGSESVSDASQPTSQSATDVCLKPTHLGLVSIITFHSKETFTMTQRPDFFSQKNMASVK